MDNKFTVVSWNIGSLKAKCSPSKPDAMSIEAWFSHISPSVVAFQESWWQDKYTKLNLDNEYVPKHAISGVKGSFSLSMYFHKSIALIDSGRIGDDSLFCQWAEIKAPRIGNLIIVNVFIPHDASIGDFSLIELLYKNIKERVSHWKKNNKQVMIVGDFNTHNPRFGIYPESNSRMRRVVLEDNLIDSLGLDFTSLPFPSRRRKGHKPLYIDHVMSTKTGLVDRVEIGYSLDGKMDDTQFPDHNPVISTLSSPVSRFSPSDTESYNWFNLSRDDWKLLTKDMESAALKV